MRCDTMPDGLFTAADRTGPGAWPQTRAWAPRRAARSLASFNDDLRAEVIMHYRCMFIVQ